MRACAILLLTFLASLAAAAPATAGALAQVDGTVLRYTADDREPVNITIDRDGGLLRLDENGSRPTAGAGCSATDDPYRITCEAAGVERIEVRLGFLGSDVRIRADLPATVHGGPGDDLIVGGPADDVIDGGGGHDIVGGGEGADVLRGGEGKDLVTYADRIGRGGRLLPRPQGVRVALGREGFSGAPGEGDTIADDVEQLAGGDGDDRFHLRDGRETAVACGAGRDLVIADPHDAVEIDCQRTRLAPARGGQRVRVATLPFPFARLRDRGRSTIALAPAVPVRRGAIVLRVSCPAGLGLLELVEAMPCHGRIRFTRPGAEMGIRRVAVPRGGSILVRLPLVASRALARRPGGLTVTATALPNRGDVVRSLSFRVRG